MYIQKATIKNIRSIIDFEIEFPNPAGWHVLIGDNGAGKSTIIRSIALALVGEQSSGLRTNWDDWLNKQAKEGEIKITIKRHENLDKFYPNNSKSSIMYKATKNEPIMWVGFSREDRNHVTILQGFEVEMRGLVEDKFKVITGEKEKGFFSVAYGPYRRFKGGDSQWIEVFELPTYANLAAHLSVFGEDVALTEAIDWLIDLNYKSLEQHQESHHTLESLKKLINSEDKDGSFLQHNAKLESVSSEGVFFKDGNGLTISVNQMSDGYRSVLSMTFELIRQLVRVYGAELVFKNIEKGEMFIDLPGVVLVDEIDAHLHPTWQTRIGNWFLKYFPKLQFIVTTHSPLVCRAAENGSIWKLAAPGSNEESGEVTGIYRDRLLYGNILDAYGTEVFGEDITIAEKTDEKLDRLAELNIKSMMGEIEEDEHAELENLKATLPTETK